MEVEKSKSESNSEFKSNSVSESQSGSISRMQPVTEGAYGGGLYGTEKGSSEDPRKATRELHAERRRVWGSESHLPVTVTSTLRASPTFSNVFSFNACLLSFCVLEKILVVINQLYLYFCLLVLFA